MQQIHNEILKINCKACSIKLHWTPETLWSCYKNSKKQSRTLRTQYSINIYAYPTCLIDEPKEDIKIMEWATVSVRDEGMPHR